MKPSIHFDLSARPVYSHLEPIVDLLITHGNSLSGDLRWRENRTGFFCVLLNPIDFDLVSATFDIPSFIRFDYENGAIECDQTWSSIRCEGVTRHA